MGGSSSSSSSNQQTTNNQLNFQGVSAPIAFEGGTANQDIFNYTTTNTLDGGAITSAFDFANNVARNSGEFMSNGLTDAIRDAFNFGSNVSADALDSNERVADSAFVFAGDFGADVLAEMGFALNGALDFGSDALDRVENMGLETVGVAENLGLGAFDLSLDALVDSLLFANRTNERLENVALESQDLAADTIEASQFFARENSNVTRDALSRVSNIASNANASVSAVARDSLFFSNQQTENFANNLSMATGLALDRVTDLSELVTGTIAGVTTQANREVVGLSESVTIALQQMGADTTALMAGLSESAIDSVAAAERESFDKSMEFATNTANTAFDFVDDLTRTDAQQLSETAIKWVMGAIAVASIAMILARK